MLSEIEKTEAWLDGALDYLLHASQVDVHARLRALPTSVRQRVVFISRRWGKSWLGVCMALEDCLRTPGAQVFICGPTLKHTNNIVVPLVKEITLEAPEGLIRHTRSDLKWEFANGSSLILGAFDTAVENFRGMRASAIYLEESGLSNPNEYGYVIKSVLLPTLAHSRGPITHLTTPSVVLDHPLHIETIPQARLNGAFFERTVYDNPLLPLDVIEELKRECGGEHTTAWRREFLVKLVRDSETVVIPEFDRDLHVREMHMPAYVNWTLAGDLGFARDMSAVTLWYYDFERATAVVWDARAWPRGTNTDKIVADVKEMEALWGVTGNNRHVDADARVLADIRDLHGLYVQLPAKDDRDAQLNKLRVAVGGASIEIHRRCEHLILTFETARWNKQRTDFERSEALGHADSLVAAMYGFRMLDRSNPFPVKYHDPGREWRRPELRPEYAAQPFQKAVVGHNFMKRRNA